MSGIMDFQRILNRTANLHILPENHKTDIFRARNCSDIRNVAYSFQSGNMNFNMIGFYMIKMYNNAK